MIYVLHQTLHQGLRSGLVSVVGVEFGTFLHVFASVFGLTVIISKSTTILLSIKYLSAVFLIYLGITQLIKARLKPSLRKNKIISGYYRPFLNAFLINIFNPKILIFFIALLPQFISPNASNANLQILLFGSLFGLMGTMVNLSVMFLMNKLNKKNCPNNHRHAIILNLTTSVVGLAFIVFGMSIIVLSAT